MNLFIKRRVYISRIVTEAIGHFAYETDLKYSKMKQAGGSKLLIINYGFFSNLALKKKWEETDQIYFAPKAFHISLNFLLNRVSAFQKLIPFENISHDDSYQFEESAPQIQLTLDDQQYCENIISDIAPQLIGKPTILFCIRDSKFDELMNRDPQNELSYRNSDPNNFLEVALHYRNLGFNVIRMGRTTSSEDYLGLRDFMFDYANSGIASDLMDLYLFSRCHFVVTTEFGIDELSTIFRKPVIVVNLLSLHSIRVSRYRSIVLPKVLVDAKTRQPLSIEEIRSRKVSNLWSVSDYVEAGVNFEDNSPSTIVSFAKEASEIIYRAQYSSYYSPLEFARLSTVMPPWWTDFRLPIISRNWMNLNI